ncbi:MAG: hypothetical protein WAM79_12225 [Candidatus Sulfotelmatobacter sp.]
MSTRRRYEAWFLRLGLADGSGAWWFRYLLTNPGRNGCPGNPLGAPAQVWATWFPAGAKPQSFIQGFSRSEIEIGPPARSSFHLRLGDNAIDEDSCYGALKVDGHEISWNLQYSSSFQVTLSNKGWIGFSRTPHSDAIFSGEITLDGRKFPGDPLAFGVQGHNCGYRHRNFWIWTHACFPQKQGSVSTLEALAYEMPFGLIFRKAVLWHNQRSYQFRNLRTLQLDREAMEWKFVCEARNGLILKASIGGGPSLHRLPYLKTDCSGTFEVANNSLASASLSIENSQQPEFLETSTGAVLEIAGNYPRV